MLPKRSRQSLAQGQVRSRLVLQQHHHPPAPSSLFLHNYIFFFSFADHHRGGRQCQDLAQGGGFQFWGHQGNLRSQLSTRAHTHRCLTLPCPVPAGIFWGFYKQARGAGPVTYPRAPFRGVWKMTKSSQSHKSARDHLSFGQGATWQQVRRESKRCRAAGDCELCRAAFLKSPDHEHIWPSAQEPRHLE